MTTSLRPTVFIGSSSEGFAVASALQANLEKFDSEVILWSQGMFGLSEGTLESLVARLQDFDFAILVLTPDDLILSRKKKIQSPRDNVIFELGLFMGALGRTRSFMVYDRTKDIKLPSDLAGITAATYQPPSVGSLESALGACSVKIQSAIEAQGVRDRSHLKLHGYSGKWAITTEFSLWRRIFIKREDHVVSNGTVLLFIPATGNGGYGFYNGHLDVRIGSCKARFNIIDEIREASVDSFGELKYITRMTLRHRTELKGKPPQKDGFEPELRGIIDGTESLKLQKNGTMVGQAEYKSFGKNYTSAITTLRRIISQPN